MGKDQGAQYLNQINPRNIYEQNIQLICYPSTLRQTKKDQILTQLMRKKSSLYTVFNFFKTFKDFLCLQNALTLSIFELEKCSSFSNRSEFCRKLIGNVISELRRQKRA